MSFFGQFPSDLCAIICDGTPFEIDLGLVSPDEHEQIELVGLQLVIRGLQPGVTMQVHGYDGVDLIGSSQVFAVQTIQDEYNATPNFYGWVRFTFAPRLNLPSTGLRLQLELFNYVYDRANTWIGVISDWPTSMGYAVSPTLPTAAPVAMELYSRAPNQ